MNFNEEIRVLGKGLTAQAIKDKFPNAILYDDKDFELYDLESNVKTIVSPGIPPYNKMIKQSVNIQSDYDLFEQIMPFPKTLISSLKFIFTLYVSAYIKQL
mgnify:CR=1 FL=1